MPLLDLLFAEMSSLKSHPGKKNKKAEFDCLRETSRCGSVLHFKSGLKLFLQSSLIVSVAINQPRSRLLMTTRVVLATD